MTNQRRLISIATAPALGAVFFATPAGASCQCLCINGEVEAVCSSALDVHPICAPRICPIVPPAVRPIDPLRIPPIGASKCRSEQVWNGQKYVWVEICR
jgi:hypothetical protein